MWIDTYCAIKTNKLNVIFVCYIKLPGDAPEFRLYRKVGRSPRAGSCLNLSMLISYPKH